MNDTASHLTRCEQRRRVEKENEQGVATIIIIGRKKKERARKMD